MKILNLSQTHQTSFRQQPQIAHKQASYKAQNNMQLSADNALESIGRAKVMFQGKCTQNNIEIGYGDGITVKFVPRPGESEAYTCKISGIEEFIKKYKEEGIPGAKYDKYTRDGAEVELIRTSEGKEIWVYDGKPSLYADAKYYD